MERVRLRLVLSRRLISAVMEVIVCSVSIARVRTDSILLKRVASSALAEDIRATLSSVRLARALVDRYILLSSASWCWRNVFAVTSTEARLDGWEKMAFKCCRGS